MKLFLAGMLLLMGGTAGAELHKLEDRNMPIESPSGLCMDDNGNILLCPPEKDVRWGKSPEKEPEVEWLGPMPITVPYKDRTDDGWWPNHPTLEFDWREDIEIGLREDGVIVWRKRP